MLLTKSNENNLKYKVITDDKINQLSISDIKSMIINKEIKLTDKNHNRFVNKYGE